MRRDGGWESRYSDADIERYVSNGRWSNRTLADYAHELVTRDPDRLLLIDDSLAADKRRLSRRTIFAQAQALAGGIRARGLQPGEAISFQLPNWYEASVINLAAVMCGLVVNPLVPIYRDAEVGFMLKDCRSRMLFIPASFRSFDYAAMAARLRPALPDLLEIVIVRGEPGPATPFDALLATAPTAPLPETDPNAAKLIMYTSGTTGRPKGVLHSHNTIATELHAVRDFWQIEPDDLLFMPSPVTHVTGFMLALELPWTLQTPALLVDRWEADRAVDLMRDEGCTITVGATPFLQELLQAAESKGERLPDLRRFVCGGASVPADLVRRAAAALENCLTFRVYGSTEVPTITLGVRDSSQAELGATTDGEIWGNEVKIVDPETGARLPPGAEGEIAARGPEVFLGYWRAADNDAAFDDEGFFLTGDLGRIEGGYITITGRKKDLIIRGGENISAKEIEDALFAHPAIAEIAVVAMPHVRMGEAACAYVVPRAGCEPTLDDIADHLAAAGLARQKCPERLEVVGELPRTPSGKVRKNVLRDEIAQRIAAEGTAR